MVLRLPFFLEDTMSKTLLELAHQLTQVGEPFVLATVVWCERPTSAKPGARAIIQANGQLTGWIGGSCAQPMVVREATRVLREGGDPYLLRLGAPDTGIARSDVRVFRRSRLHVSKRLPGLTWERAPRKKLPPASWQNWCRCVVTVQKV